MGNLKKLYRYVGPWELLNGTEPEACHPKTPECAEHISPEGHPEWSLLGRKAKTALRLETVTFSKHLYR